MNHYTLDGLGLAVSASTELTSAIHSRLRFLSTEEPGLCELTYESRCVPDRDHHRFGPPRGRARPVYEPPMGDVLYSDAEDQLYINYGDRVRVLCDPSNGSVRLSIVPPETDCLWQVSHPLFTIPLMEIMKRRGRYSLHAAGLSLNGKGLLLAGASGAGKSTLAVALLMAGFGFLGDDTLFLAPGPQGLRILAFPDEIDLTEGTASLIPELHSLLNQPASPGWPKRQVRADDVHGLDLVWECRPSLLVFPRVTGSEKSVLTPITREEALLELLPNVLLTEARSSQAHLDALGELVRASACYRLETGRDFEELASRFRDLLA